MTEKPNELIILASPDGREESITINQNVILYACKFRMINEHQSLSLTTTNGSQYWLQIISGEIALNANTLLKPGDGAGIKRESHLTFTALADETEVLLFEILS